MSRMASSDGSNSNSVLLKTNRKLASLIITSRIPSTQNAASDPDTYLNLATPKIKAVEQEIDRIIQNRDEETLIDIIALKEDGSSQLIERWKIHHELRSLDGFTPPTPKNMDSATLSRQMICLSRAVSAYLPLLPAARVSRACQSYLDQNHSPPLALSYHLYQASHSPAQLPFRGEVTNFSFKPSILTPKGNFRVTLHYQVSLSELDFAPLESDRFGAIPVEIVEDYASVRASSSQQDSRQNSNVRVYASSHGHVPSPLHSTQSKTHQTPRSLPQHSDHPRHSPLHQPQQVAEQHQLRHSHSTPFSIPESSPMRDDHASSPPIPIPGSGHSYSNSSSSQSHNYPNSQHSTSLPSRTHHDRLGRSPSLSSSRPHSHTPVAYSPASPFMGPRRYSLSKTPRSSLLAPQPLPESPIPPIHGMLGSSTASLSREAQIGYEIERVGNIAPPRSSFTNDASGTAKLRSMKADDVMNEARQVLDQFAQPHQQQQEAS